jgi:Zn finger protein HypA/HybF involved in hydrogenase expression
MDFLEKIFFFDFPKKKINKETTETKKCRNCLKRIKLDYFYCPYCSSKDFDYDS